VRKAVVEIGVRESPLFARHVEGEADLPSAFVEAFTRAVSFEVFNSGEWVMHKGMLTAALSVIAQGSVQVLIDEESSVVIAQLDVGDCFGEHSALTGSKANASIRAKEPLELLVVPRAKLLGLCEEFPPFAQRLHTVEARRKRENDFIVKWGLKSRQLKGGDGVSASDLADAAKEEAQRTEVGGFKSWKALKQVADMVGHQEQVHNDWKTLIATGRKALPPTNADDADGDGTSNAVGSPGEDAVKAVGTGDEVVRASTTGNGKRVTISTESDVPAPWGTGEDTLSA